MKNIFFIRHQNDFEFMLPLIMCETKSLIVIYGDLNQESKNKLIANKLMFIDIYSRNSFIYLIYRLLNKITLGSLNKKITTTYEDYLLFNIDRNIKKNIKKIQLTSCSNVIFDHTVSKASSLLVSFIKNCRVKANLDLQIISIPHGVGCYLNNMVDFSDVAPSYLSDYDIYDKIICNDMQHFNHFLKSGIHRNKLIIIGNLRYTKTWVDSIVKDTFTKTKNNTSTNKNLLIVHTKFIGNINSQEVKRCLRILNNFKRFNIKIKSHPRGGLKEALNLAKPFEKIKVVSDNILTHIAWCDYVIFFGSSVAYDAFILDKPVVFPSYITSNILSDEILNGVISLGTPDAFYDFFNDIANGNIYKNDYKYPDNYQEVMKSWQKVLN